MAVSASKKGQLKMRDRRRNGCSVFLLHSLNIDMTIQKGYKTLSNMSNLDDKLEIYFLCGKDKSMDFFFFKIDKQVH